MMIDDVKRAYDWLESLASGKGFASYLIGAPEEARHAAEVIKHLVAELETKDKYIANSQQLHIKAEKAVRVLINQNKRLQHAKRERDAAISDLTNTGPCFACKHFQRNDGECKGAGICYEGAYFAEEYGKEYTGPSWEWRGPCSENGGTK